MKFTVVALAAAASVANAQLIFNSTTNTFQCLGTAAGKDFCAGESLQTNIIIRCSGTTGQPGNCNDNLAGVPPVGVKSSALCYQTSNTTGDAACSFNGVAYPDSGSSFTIPGASSTASASSTVSASSVVYGSATTTAVYSSVATSKAATTTVVATGTGGYVQPTGNATTYTTSLPTPSLVNSGASSLALQGGMIASLVGFVAAFML